VPSFLKFWWSAQRVKSQALINERIAAPILE